MGGFNCKLKVVRGQPKWAWTCPCGLGYWDGIKKESITGDRVRRGEALTRADYEGHLRECSRCHAQARKDSLTLVSSKDEGRETQPRTGVRPSARNSASLHSQAVCAAQHQYFLPMEGIHPEVIQSVTEKYLGPGASVKLASSQVGIQVINDHKQRTLLILFPCRTVDLAIS
jgi:hypothetical protein